MKKKRVLWCRGIVTVLAMIMPFALYVVGARGQQTPRTLPQQNGNGSAGKEIPSRSIELSITPVAWSPVTGSYEPTADYKQGATVLVEVVLKNQMAEPTNIDISLGNHLFQWRPRLVKDGNLLPYRKGINEKLDKVDNEIEPFHGSRVSYRLEPAIAKRVGFLPLDDWYDLPLAPGQYQLTFWYRFWGKEKPAKSNTATFEVQ